MSETVAETATAAETENDSMERLQIDEEDEKNASAEDFLGGKSLMMSDSEDDETPTGASKQISPKKKIKRTKEADEQMEVPEQAEAMEEDTEVKKSPKKQKKKISAIIDSESEEELGEPPAAAMVEKKEATKSKPRKKISAIVDSEREQEYDAAGRAAMEEETNVSSQEKQQEMDKPPKSKKKISAIIDSESEEDQPSKETSKPKPKKKISAIIDSDSEEEQQVQQEEKHSKHKKKSKSKKQTKEKQQRMDSEEESSAQSSDEDSSSGAQKKLKGIVDSESESERSNADEPMDDQEQSNVPTDKPKKSKPMRASAKKALDDMQAIQSEQQRLHREAHISVPYHQPKPRTLKEFLSRRTINKPLELALAGGSPMPSKKEPRRSLALRMNSEELQAYAKLMEERAKEATEFFKSESEHEDDNEEKVGEGEAEETGMEMKLDEVAESTEQSAKAASEVDVDGTQAVQEMTADNVAGTESEPLIEPSVEAASPTKAVLVTEVVELPKLELSTLSITPPSKPSTPRISEAIRRLRDEKSSDVSPSLKGDPNMVIDLETGDMFAKKPTGVDDLLQRLMKTREAKKHKTTETVNILSTTHGKLEMSKVNIHLHEEEPVNKEQKPGAAYIKMQEHLKSLITKKRMEEMRKKKAEEEEAENDEMDVDEEYEPDEKPCKSQVIVNEDEEIVDEEADEDAEEEEAQDGEETDAACADKEQEADGDEEECKEELNVEATSSSEAESEPEEETTQTQGKRKNRIIRAFQDDNSDDDDMDLLQTPKQNTVAPVTASQLQLSAQKLFDAEVERTASDEENELLGLCSGRFTQAESSAAPSAGALISQIPITQVPESSQAPEELEALCSGTFETQPAALPEPATNKIVSSDDEAPKQTEEEEKPRQKKLTKKRQKKKAKLGFSDDEEEETSEEEGEDQSDIEEPVEEVPETFVDYDSEENEVVVQMTKKDRKLRAANFVEKEAELSESEWGSADEDEKNMDKYDIELGDEDEFDREKLQHELGQIHARKMLDKDIREVRQIQEMLFEDEEGAVRQRQFRWKNAESAGFSLDDTRNENADADANEGSGDEENEHLWRKIRYEREQLLLEKGLKGDATASSPAPLSPAVLNSNVASGAVRKLTIITAKKTTVELKKSSPFLISKSVNAAQKQQAVRGSFLVRDKDTLNKLAGLTKGGAGDVDGTAGTVNVKSAKGKNFVFATLTEEEHESQKRKAADLLNSSSETGINFMKKPRIEPRREKCLIDQLL